MLGGQAVSLAYAAYFFGESLVFSVIYLWAREVPDQQARPGRLLCSCCPGHWRPPTSAHPSQP